MGFFICDGCKSEQYGSYECCDREFCESCLEYYGDTIKVYTEEEESIYYSELSTKDFILIDECPYCAKDIEKMKIDDIQLFDYVLVKYNLEKEKLISEVKEKRSKGE